MEVGEAGEQESVQTDTSVIYYCLYPDILHLRRKAKALSSRARYLRPRAAGSSLVPMTWDHVPAMEVTPG